MLSVVKVFVRNLHLTVSQRPIVASFYHDSVHSILRRYLRVIHDTLLTLTLVLLRLFKVHRTQDV